MATQYTEDSLAEWQNLPVEDPRDDLGSDIALYKSA